ncbi:MULTISPECIES: SMP-30/gluconolactonase/LRE family protein [Roseobacteraceae]|nr:MULTISPECIES: SMP-30/gluconolactonase/LRE family protein [Roseobacteraceae]
MMKDVVPDIAVAVRAKATIGESPIWSARRERLLWIDIMGRQLHTYDPATGRDEVTELPTDAGLLAESPSGEIVLGLDCGLARLGDDGEIEHIASAPHADPAFRFNDGRFDPQGRLWAGLMNKEGKKGSGVLYRFDPDGTWHIADTGFDLPNGLEWSRDGKTFYFTDSHKGKIYAYDFDPVSGKVENRRPFFGMNPADGKPDGLAMDPEGYFLSVLFDGSAILRIAPDGVLDLRIRLPVPRPTSCAFGGDGRTLFITTARIGLSDTQLDDAPLSGALLQLDYDDALR